MIRNVWHDNGKLTIRGKRRDKVRGRSAFKLPNLLSMHFSGRGDDYIREGGKVGALATFYGMIEHCQRLFDDEEIVLRVLGESGGWPFLQAGAGMFGSPPRDHGIHDVASYRILCEKQDRVHTLTALNGNILEELFRASATTGIVFEYVCDATLKHTDGMCTGVIDHVIRQTASWMRVLQEEYPRAAFIFSTRNELEAHNDTRTTLQQVNAWATRFYRWGRPDPSNPQKKETRISFDRPDGEGWEAEQWPEGFCIVDHGGRDMFEYECGPEPGEFKLGALHPERKRGNFHKRDKWTEVTKEWMADVRRDARGQPIGFTESMYLRSKPGTEGWYRNQDGLNDDEDEQLLFYEACEQDHGPDLYYVHDDIGVQSDPHWNAGSRWESMLAEFYGGRAVEPKPTRMRRYEGLIQRDFLELLGHQLEDEDELEFRNEMFRQYYEDESRNGWSREDHRTVLVQSEEFRQKHPEVR